MFRLAIILVLLLLAPAGYFTIEYAREKVLAELIDASRRDDVAAMATRVDWDALRAFLKEDIAAQKRSVGPQGEAIGPPQAQIDAVVDYYVQPENIDILYYRHDVHFPGVPEEDFIGATGYAAPFGFSVTLVYPKNAAVGDPILAAVRDRIRVTLVFGLDGLTWKVKKLQVPVYLSPTKRFDAPALQIYGRPPAS